MQQVQRLFPDQNKSKEEKSKGSLVFKTVDHERLAREMAIVNDTREIKEIKEIRIGNEIKGSSKQALTRRNATNSLYQYLLSCIHYLHKVLGWQFVICKSKRKCKKMLCYFPVKQIYDKEGTDTIYTNMQYNFVHVDTIPSYFHVDARKKKWLWNNKNDWKGYKRELKAYKDSIKRARKLNSKH